LHGLTFVWRGRPIVLRLEGRNLRVRTAKLLASDLQRLADMPEATDGDKGVHHAFVDDPTDRPPTGIPALTRLTTGARRLRARLLHDAIEDAARGDRDARAWLRGWPAPLTARDCFEFLGYDYETTVDKLMESWT
jgi:hypothetical protein